MQTTLKAFLIHNKNTFLIYFIGVKIIITGIAFFQNDRPIQFATYNSADIAVNVTDIVEYIKEKVTDHFFFTKRAIFEYHFH